MGATNERYRLRRPSSGQSKTQYRPNYRPCAEQLGVANPLHCAFCSCAYSAASVHSARQWPIADHRRKQRHWQRQRQRRSKQGHGGWQAATRETMTTTKTMTMTTREKKRRVTLTAPTLNHTRTTLMPRKALMTMHTAAMTTRATLIQLTNWTH